VLSREGRPDEQHDGESAGDLGGEIDSAGSLQDPFPGGLAWREPACSLSVGACGVIHINRVVLSLVLSLNSPQAESQWTFGSEHSRAAGFPTWRPTTTTDSTRLSGRSSRLSPRADPSGTTSSSHRDISKRSPVSACSAVDGSLGASLQMHQWSPSRFTRGVSAPAQSIVSGPLISACRNCVMNWLSESKSWSLAPDSTILPFHSTARKSGTRRAVARSWLIIK